MNCLRFFIKTLALTGVVILQFLQNNINAQDDNDICIYGIMSMSTDLRTHAHEAIQFDKSDTSYLSLLLRLDKDSIYVVDTLNFDHRMNNTMRSIVHHAGQEFFVFREKDMFDYYDSSVLEKDLHKNNEYLTVLDYGITPFKIRKINADSLNPFYGATGASLPSYIVNNQYCWPYTLGKSYFLLSKKMTHSYQLNDYDRMRNYSVENMPGYSKLKTYTFVFHPQKKYILERNSFNEWSQWVEFKDFSYPAEEEDGNQYKSFKIFYHTVQSKYTIGKKSGGDKYFIRDNNTLLWDTLSLPFNKFSVYEDEYLYGTLLRYGSSSVSLNYRAEGIRKKYSPLYASYPNTSGLTGEIFIYHIPTRKNIVFKGANVDTEFLALKNGWAYFREYDSIKKIRLDKNNFSFDYESIKIIARDLDYIPNVHHVFFAPRSDVEVENVVTE